MAPSILEEPDRVLSKRPRFSALTRFGLVAGLALALTACAPGPQKPPQPNTNAPIARYDTVRMQDLPGWDEDRVVEALPAFLSSCARLAGKADNAPIGPAPLGMTVGDYKVTCDALSALIREAGPNPPSFLVRSALEGLFTPVAVKALEDGSRDGRFTGYYEAELFAARQPDALHQVPIYGVPEDLVMKGSTGLRDLGQGRTAPYFTRAEIDDGALAGRAPVLFWAQDAVDLHVLQIQGSGVVTLPDGSRTRIGYAANNGHKFVGIGGLMLKRGLGEGGDMRSIRRWLKANPDQAWGLMRENPRYIFFQENTGPGPIGAQGVALTSGRSLAVDTRAIPLGSLLWVDVSWPGRAPLRQLMVAQDVGAAIKGAVRGDVFFGTGERALDLAGGFNNPGRYYLFVPRYAGFLFPSS
ncbi:MAG: murein transglycosylase A [Rhodospirillaceae bacterium]